MTRTFDFIQGLLVLIVGLILLVWVMYQWLRRTREDPKRLVFKWILTALIIIFILAPLGMALTTSGPGGAFLVPFVAVGGLLLAIIWTPTIVGWVGSKFEQLYTGGDDAIEPKPFYSIAQARRKRGEPAQALLEVEKQLARFPLDLTGHLLKAEIEAVDLRELETATRTIQEFCDLPDLAPETIVPALNALADWHLDIGREVISARHALQQIIDRLPDTEFAARAAQRIAHLGTPETRKARDDRSPIRVHVGVSNVGLMLDSSSVAKAQEANPERSAQELVQHLAEHPLDTEAREQLAVLYADHYGRLDLAADQLEQMIQMPTQPARNVVRWLNQMADLQLKYQPDYDSVRLTLLRIIDLYPDSAAAELARQRIEHLRLDLKGKEKGRVVKLGQYEQNIGLKEKPDSNSPSPEA